MDIKDQQQQKLIEQYITQYEKGQLKLDRLINVLNALLEVLQVTPEKWKDDFRSEWWTLEQIYAVSLDDEQLLFQKETQDLIKETLENMKKLLGEVLVIEMAV